MKKLTTLILFCLTIFFLTGCLEDKKETQTNTTEQQKQKKQKTTSGEFRNNNDHADSFKF